MGTDSLNPGDVVAVHGDLPSVVDNISWFKVCKSLSIEDVHKNITNQLNTNFEKYYLTPWDKDMYICNLNVILESLVFIQEVLYINKIVVQKAYSLLSAYLIETKSFLDIFFKSYCYLVSYGDRYCIDDKIKSFLKFLIVKQPILCDKFLFQLFDVCIKQNNPLIALEIGLCSNGCFENCEKIQKHAYEWIHSYTKKSQLLQNSILNFSLCSLPTSDENYNNITLTIENLMAYPFNEETTDLIYNLLFESLLLNPSLDRSTDSNPLSYFTSLINFKSASKSELIFEDKTISKIFALLADHTYKSQNSHKGLFINNAKELWVLINDKKMQQTNLDDHVQVTELKKKFINIKLDDGFHQLQFEENIMLKKSLKHFWETSGFDEEDDTRNFVKQYSYENLHFCPELTCMIIETPFLDPNYSLSESGTPQSKLHLKLNFFEYLILLAFGNEDNMNFESLKGCFYQYLDNCYPHIKHNDDNSRSLFKKSLKPIYKSNLLISHNWTTEKKNSKTLKWGAFLAKWKECFEKDNYTNFTLSLNINKKLNIDKSKYILDNTLGRYVCCL
ncbi:unnamed protein product [Hanseniaspora opuntiae]